MSLNTSRVEEVNGAPQVVAYKGDGEKLYSVDVPGQIAGLDEAVKYLWNHYPNKDVYSKQPPSGSGSIGNSAGSNVGVSSISRADWNAVIQDRSSANNAKKIDYIISSN